MSITIKELAKKAGVSKTAVSFAFNYPERLSTETYNKIMTIAEETGFTPNPVARILSRRQTVTIGFVLPQELSIVLKNPFFAELLCGIGSVCEEKGYALSVLSPQQGLIAQTIREAAVDGILVHGVSRDSDMHQICRQREIPYVTIDAYPDDHYVNVGIDDCKYSYELMKILLENGHRNICVCSLELLAQALENDLNSITNEARLNGILSACQEFDVDKSSIRFIRMPTSIEASYKTALTVLGSPNRPTAIFCMGDIQAYGFYLAARDLELSIPQDCSIVSFDDLPSSQLLTPGITTVHQDGCEKGKIAARQLFNLIEGKPCASVVMEASVICRESVATLPKR